MGCWRAAAHPMASEPSTVGSQAVKAVWHTSTQATTTFHRPPSAPAPHLSDAVAHAVARDHGARQPRGLLQVAARARGHVLLACGRDRKEEANGQQELLSQQQAGWAMLVLADAAHQQLHGGRQLTQADPDLHPSSRDFRLQPPTLPSPAHKLQPCRAPKMSSSATRPPMQTSSLASSWRRDTLVSSSVSGSCVTMPSAMPGDKEGGEAC